MADAWDTLFGNSSLGAGHDAWEHLNAQEGGSEWGPGDGVVLTDGLEIEMNCSRFEIEIESSEMLVEVDVAEYEIEIETNSLEIEVC